MSTARHSFTLRLMAFLKERPNQIIPATDLEQFGRQAWRTRLSEARKRFEAANDGTIEYRPLYLEGDDAKTITISRYRYVPRAPEESGAPHDLNDWALR